MTAVLTDLWENVEQHISLDQNEKPLTNGSFAMTCCKTDSSGHASAKLLIYIDPEKPTPPILIARHSSR